MLRTGILEIKNKQDFATLAWIRGEWELKVGRQERGQRQTPRFKDSARRQMRKLILSCLRVAAESGQEAFFNLRFFAAVATCLVRIGHEVGWDQISIPAKSDNQRNPRQQVNRPVTDSR